MKYEIQIKITKNVTYQEVKMLKNQNNLSQNIIYSIFEGPIKSASCENLCFSV